MRREIIAVCEREKRTLSTQQNNKQLVLEQIMTVTVKIAHGIMINAEKEKLIDPRWLCLDRYQNQAGQKKKCKKWYLGKQNPGENK